MIRNSLSYVLFFACAVGFAFVDNALAATLISQWTFDDANGSGVVVDSVSGNDGTVFGSAAQGIPGKFNKAISLDGIDDYVDFGDLTDFEFAANESFSMAFWFKTTNTPGSFGLQKGDFFKGAGGAFPVYTLKANGTDPGGSVRMEARSKNGSTYYTTAAFNNDAPEDRFDGEWHHLAGTYDGTDQTFRVYVDGVLEATSSSHGDPTVPAWGTNARSLLAGAEEYNGAKTYGTGAMDNASIWSGKLTDQEVAALVPEPGSLLLSALAGFACLGLFGRCRLAD